MSPPGRVSWEENTERRVGIIEQKLDKILDPEAGIYSKITGIESRLKGWAIMILSSVAISLIVQLTVQG